MKSMNVRKTLVSALLIGSMTVTACAMADPQGAHGPYGMSSGMMGGFNMDLNMMSGYGSGYNMGSGMMGSFVARSDLNLTAEQRSKIGKIQEDVRHMHWDLMGKIQDEQVQMTEQFNSDKPDDAALSKSYRKVSELRHQMFDLSLSARSQIDAVLTKDQREKQKHG